MSISAKLVSQLFEWRFLCCANFAAKATRKEYTKNNFPELSLKKICHACAGFPLLMWRVASSILAFVGFMDLSPKSSAN